MKVWQEYFGYLKAQGYTVAIGEFGSNPDWPNKAELRFQESYACLTLLAKLWNAQTPTPINGLLGNVGSYSLININIALRVARYSAGLSISNINTAVADVNRDSLSNTNHDPLIARYSASLMAGF